MMDSSIQPPFDPKPIILENQRIRLEPLQRHHAAALLQAGQDPTLWNYMPCPVQSSIQETQSWIEEALTQQERGLEIPFAIIDTLAKKAIGSTRYLDIQRPHRGLEIGWTWMAQPYHGSGTNAECKRLLMSHAFEELGAIRVQLKTDARNQRSQRAMEKLGFTREGILRKSRLCWDGHYRDTVYYSVLAEEWPTVKERMASILIHSAESFPIDHSHS